MNKVVFWRNYLNTLKYSHIWLLRSYTCVLAYSSCTFSYC